MTQRFGKVGLDLVARMYLRKLRKELANHTSLSDVQTEDIYADAVLIWKDSVNALTDSRTKILYAFCSLALSTSRAVSLRDSPQLAFDISSRAVTATLSYPSRIFFRSWLWRWSQPIGMLQSWGIAEHLQDALGPSMRFEEQIESDGVDLIITKCGFRDFFAMHGEPVLTKAMCGYDHIWMSLINTSARPITVSRRSALSLASENCHFSFSDTDHETKPIDVVWLDTDVRRAAR